MTTIKRNKHRTMEEKIDITTYLDKYGYAKTIEKYKVSRSALDCWVKLRSTTGITNSKSGTITVVESRGMEPFLSISKMTPEEITLAMEYFSNLEK